MKNYLSLLIIAIIMLSGCGSTSTELRYPIPKEASMYEDAEDGLVKRWEIKDGFSVENVETGANGSDRSIFVKQNWLLDDDGEFLKDENGFAINAAYYELKINNDKQYVLQFDKMKIDSDRTYCFTVGAKVDTTNGIRYISFNTFYDRQHMEQDSVLLDDDVKEFISPLSMSYVNDTNVWKHIRLDLPKYLHNFEPNNHILSVKTFYFQGGNDYLDNIYFTAK